MKYAVRHWLTAHTLASIFIIDEYQNVVEICWLNKNHSLKIGQYLTMVDTVRDPRFEIEPIDA